jgi:hypothetical protein
VLAAAHPALNRAGEGSSPSGPIRQVSTGGPAAGHRTRNAAAWVRVPPGALRFFDNSVTVKCAHDVAAACRLAMAEVRVRLPLGTWTTRGVGKSGNPPASGAGERRFESGRPDWINSGGVRAGTSARLLTGRTRVRFLPPELHVEGRANGRWQPSRKRPSDEPWGFDSPSFRLAKFLLVPLAERSRHRLPRSDRRVRLPQGTLGDRLMVGHPALNRTVGVRVHLPEPAEGGASRKGEVDPGQLLLVVTPRPERGGRWFDPSPRN